MKKRQWMDGLIKFWQRLEFVPVASLPVIPAKAGIHCHAPPLRQMATTRQAARKSHTAFPFTPPLDSYARYRSRWIPAGMTACFFLFPQRLSCITPLSLTLPARGRESDRSYDKVGFLLGKKGGAI
jgi:hypothetical protein